MKDGESMKTRSAMRVYSLALLVALLAAVPASAATVLQMNLDGLVERSGSIYRVTVVSVEPGSVSVGGGELDTIIYGLQVVELLQGDVDDGGKEAPYVEITVLGDLKDESAANGTRHLAQLPQAPRLEKGGDYVLFTTPASAVGLSTTVGLGQGAFKIYDGPDHQELAVNELGNLGLFSGPVTYTALADAIRARVGG
jgi:hypothetical protein